MSKVLQENSAGVSGMSAAWQRIDRQDGISAGWQVGVFLLVVCAVFSRLPSALLHPQFFAEDGWVWYQQAYNLGWWRSLLISQAGYMQTLPRLVTGVALLLPMLWAPLIFNLAGAAVQALPVTALLSRRCKTWGPLSVRMLMALMYVAIPNASEIHIVLTNAMWHLAVLQALLAFSDEPLTWRGRVTDVVLFSVGAISGPMSLLLVPAVAVFWWVRRQRWTLVVLGILCVGSVVQVWTILHSVRGAATPLGATPAMFIRLVGGNIFLNSVAGSRGLGHPLWVPLLGFIAGLAFVVFGLRQAPLALRLYALFAVLAAAASLHDPLVLINMPRWQAIAGIAGLRYWFYPSLMFLWCVVWCAVRGGNRAVRWAGWAVLALSLVLGDRAWVWRWSQSHYSEDVKRFESARPGEHVIFPIYPDSRTMELIKR